MKVAVTYVANLFIQVYPNRNIALVVDTPCDFQLLSGTNLRYYIRLRIWLA